MGGYHWEQIVMMLLDRIENMKVHEDEMNQEINRLMGENVRLNQVLREKDEIKPKVIKLVSDTHGFCRKDVLKDLLNKIGEL